MSDKKITEVEAARDILQKWNCATYGATEVLEEFRKIVAPTPAQVDEDVIEAMYRTYFNEAGDRVRPMTAAATVLLDRVLGAVTEEEWENDTVFETVGRGGALDLLGVNDLLANRRNSILKPEPPSLEQEIVNEIKEWTLVPEDNDGLLLAKTIMALISRHSEVKK